MERVGLPKFPNARDRCESPVHLRSASRAGVEPTRPTGLSRYQKQPAALAGGRGAGRARFAEGGGSIPAAGAALLIWHPSIATQEELRSYPFRARVAQFRRGD